MPILSRIFLPKDFGIFAYFLSITTIISSVISGRYELGIVAAISKKESEDLFYFSLKIGLFFFVLFQIISLAFYLFDIKIKPIDSNLLLVLPIFIWSFNLTTVLKARYNALKFFNDIGLGNVVSNGATIGSQSLLYILNVFGSVGLIIGRIISEVILSVYYLFKKDVIELSSIFKKANKQFETAKKFYEYPLYTVPSTLVNKIRVEIPNILIVAFFNPVVAGYYAVSKRIFNPLGFISVSIQKVYFQKYSELINEDRDPTSLMIGLVIFLALLGGVCGFIFYLSGEYIIKNYLGNKWIESYNYILILLPGIITRFIFSPIGDSLYVLRKNSVVFIWTLTFLLLTLLAFWVGSIIGDIKDTLKILVSVEVLMYISHFILNLYFTKKRL